MMEILELKSPYPNGVDAKDEHLLQSFVDTLDEVRDKILAGERVYIEITSGERKGSIAYIEKFDPDYTNKQPLISRYRSTFKGENKSRVTNQSLHVILRWDGRQNRIKWSTINYTIYLRGYNGPTCWEKFDKNAAAKKLLEENDVLDRDGVELKVGHRVLYINARYGSGASLDRGTIEKIHFTVQKHAEREFSAVHVIIKNDNGQSSDIKNPNLSVLKIIEEKAKV